MSSVIKAGKAEKIQQHLSPIRLTDHVAEARKTVEAATRQAEQTLAQAYQEKEKVFEEARQAGHKKGHEKGYDEGKDAGYKDAFNESQEVFLKEHSNIVSNLQQLITCIDSDREDLQIASERNLLEFAVSVAKKLTYEIGIEYRESAMENLKRATKIIGTKTDLNVRMHPDDVESMKKFSDSLIQQLSDSVVCNLIKDESMSPGGCVVANEITEVDATLDTQVDEMVTLLLGRKTDHG